MPSLTNKTIDLLALDGWVAYDVEKKIPHTNITKDLFGFIDILAIRPCHVMGIQVTTYSHINARLNKARGLIALSYWLSSKALFEVWGWKKEEVIRVSVGGFNFPKLEKELVPVIKGTTWKERYVVDCKKVKVYRVDK
jgi:hypothetical protein